MANYLYLPRIQIQGANAMQAPWLLSPAPIMAANMFAHALCLNQDVDVTSLLYLHHDNQIEGLKNGSEFHAAQRIGASSFGDQKRDYAGASMSLSTQPSASMHLTVSLFFQIDDDEVDLDEVTRFLHRGRFAGGAIIDHGTPELLSSENEVVNRAKSGFWLIMRQDLAHNYEGKPDAYAAYLASTAKSEENNQWLAAACLGYALLTEPRPKANSRFDKPHAYAEPLIGAVQFVSVNQFQEKDTGVFRLPYWHYASDNQVFRLTQSTITV